MSSWPTQFDEESDFYDIHQVSLARLLHICNAEVTPLEFIEAKQHVRFLQEYLQGKNGLRARYALVEQSYVSKDYLTDFSFYYSSCFEQYSKLCNRVHFFTSDLDKEDFLNQLHERIVGAADSTDARNFWTQSYLGYIIVKPTPNYFIGFTLLKHYNFNSSNSNYSPNRNYWGVKDYKVHLFGTEVVVESLAFQEQDKNVAACATIAIWSMLQRAAEDYYITLQSPSEITRGAAVVSHDGNRLIPNKGLSVLQMAQAIAKTNMTTEVREISSYHGQDSFNLYIKKLIHAYSPLHVPIILAIQVFVSKEESVGHAVATCGYNMISDESNKRKLRLLGRIAKFFDKNVEWEAERINKLYCHDDQWGPFSRMWLEGGDRISSSWNLVLNVKKQAKSLAIIIPVYQKVRIPYEDIENKILGINGIIEEHLKGKYEGRIVWNIQLYLSEDFKREFKKNGFLDITIPGERDLQYKFLTRNFPKYIWAASMKINSQPVYHFIYDATGLSGSNLIHTIFGYYREMNTILLQILEGNRTTMEVEFAEIFDFNVERFIEKIREFDSPS